MNRKADRIRHRRGVSLVSTLVAVVILLIALIGTSSFRYHAALDARRADGQTSAARIALMLCESWAGVDGVLTYNPVVQLGDDLVITTSTTGPAKPDDFTLLGTYTVALENYHGVNYYATLSWKDVQTGLRALNVVVAWAQRGPGTNGVEQLDKTFKLTVHTATW